MFNANQKPWQFPVIDSVNPLCTGFLPRLFYFREVHTMKNWDNEKWKPIQNYTRYFVSNLGRVCGPTGKILRQATRLGYKRVNLCKSSSYKTHSVHLLVLEAFIGACPKEKEAHHINHNPSDNRLSNLEYITHSENVQIAYDSGRKVAIPQPGENHPLAKLTNNDVLEIRRIAYSIPSVVVAKHYNISTASICNILKRRSWKHI